MKKLLYSALILAMVLGFGATALGAAGDLAPPAFNDIAGHEAEGELTLLGAMGIFTGETGLGGAVKPDDTLTRAQFCKVVVMAAGRGNTALGLMGLRPTFTDECPTWAWGYINVAVYMGVIGGYPDGTFGANNPVSYAEAVTMLVRAVSGHKAQVSTTMPWPYNYIFYGVDNGFTGNVDVGFANLPCTRGDMAQMTFATMQVNKLEADGDEIAHSSMFDLRGCELFEGTVTAFGGGTITLDGGLPMDLADPVWMVGADSYDAVLNLGVWGVLNPAHDVFFLETTEDSNTFAGIFDALDVTGTTDYLVFEDGTKIPYTAGVPVTYNGQDGYDETELAGGEECLVYLNGDGFATNINALWFDLGLDWITAVTPSQAGPPAVDTQVEFDDNGGPFDVTTDCLVTINGAAANRDSLARYDAVWLATFDCNGLDLIAIRATRQTVAGTVYSKNLTYPGPVQWVTIDKTGGGRQTYMFTGDGGCVVPNVNDVVKYGLDDLGRIYVPIGFAPLTPYVQLLGWDDGTTGDTLTVDSRGTTTVYATDGDDYSGFVFDGTEFGRLTIDTATNKVTNFVHADNWSTGTAEVLAVDAVNKTMTLLEDGDVDHDAVNDEVIFVDDPSIVIYVLNTAGDYVYGGWAGLKVGDVLTVCWEDFDGGGEDHVIWLEQAP